MVFAGKQILSDGTAELNVTFFNIVRGSRFGFDTEENNMLNKITLALPRRKP